MTEQEAKQKWCPFSGGRAFSISEVGRYECIGSDCAAWRFNKQQTAHADGTHSNYSTADGHCGLAGKP